MELVAFGGPTIVGPGKPAPPETLVLPNIYGTLMLNGLEKSGSLFTPSICP